MGHKGSQRWALASRHPLHWAKRGLMKTWKKITLALGGVVVVRGIIFFSIQQSRKGVVEVQTGKVTRQDLVSQVTASGEIRPKTFVNVGANAYGKIVHL